MRVVQTKTTYLQMFRQPAEIPLAPPGPDFEVSRIDYPGLEFYRRLYVSVGGAFNWVDRLLMPDDQLLAIIQDQRTDVFVLRVSGKTAGYAELDRRTDHQIELAYFGLFPEFLGQGWGKFFLNWTVQKAWSFGPRRVWLHTCDLDHPAALIVYRKAGFEVYDEKLLDQVIPDIHGDK